MKLGEVCLLTNNVVRLANFYKALLNVNNKSDDEIHQFIISKETMLSIYNDGSEKNNNNQNICIAFSCDDVYAEFERIKKLGAEIIEGPQARPWGAINMSFFDPDSNRVYIRSLNKNQ